MVNQYFFQVKNIFLIIIEKIKNKSYCFLFLLIISCYNRNNDYEIKNKEIYFAIDDFIEESKYKAANQSKVLVINFLKYENDTILYFERTEPYRKKNYKGKIVWKGYDLFLYSNLKSNYIIMNKISQDNLKYATDRNMDLPYRKGYKFEKGKLIENYDY
jgi:hypothetical protein